MSMTRIIWYENNFVEFLHNLNVLSIDKKRYIYIERMI